MTALDNGLAGAKRYVGLAAGANDRSSDPAFTGGGDYHLSLGSACRNSGTDLGIAIDLDGFSRPFNARDAGFDMGCYEAPPRPSGTLLLVR